MFQIIKKKPLLFHVFGWVILFSFISLLVYTQNNPLPKSIPFKLGFGVFFFYVNYYFLVPEFLLKRKFVPYTIFSFLIITITASIYTVLKFSFGENISDSKIISFIITSFFYVIILFFGIALKIFYKWNEDEKQKLEIVSKKVTSELQNLKNQINPHFLFNSLNSIYSLTLQSSSKAPDAVMMLSNLMRYMLYETNSDYVVLEKEIEYLKNFVKLQKLQIANSENIKLNIKGIITYQKISPLILISFIENAFKYGTDFSGNTKIDINIYIKDNELQFRCENIIGNRTEASNKEYGGIGIKNTKERLKLSYLNKHWLTIEENSKTYIVSLNLKLN
ncbi:sensor histidine kinase [Tenacibaculum ovolyticum]|uniref:sensor histidine kinase n=1 Tax=Tenacibaculum ovolyticum TaxID=104270 RepID=UPI003BAA50AD